MSWRLVTRRMFYKKALLKALCVVHLVVLFIIVLCASLSMLLDCQLCTTGEAYIVSYQRVVGCGVRVFWYLLISIPFLNLVFGRKVWRYQRANSGPRLGLAQKCVYLLIAPCSLGTATKRCVFADCKINQMLRYI